MRVFERTPWIAAAVCVVCLSGCFTRPSRGEAGVVELAWDEGAFGCLFGCDATEPMAAHANAGLTVVNADEVPPFDASSADEGVFEIIQSAGTGDASLRVVSHEAGSAHVVFTGTDGDEIDRYELEVRDVARIELSSPAIRERYLLMVGGTDSLQLDLFDSRDRRLKGYGGVEYTLSGSIGETELTLVSAIAEAIARAFVGSTTERASVEALAVGSGTIEIAAPSGAALTVPVEVVDASAVRRVEVESETDDVGSSATVSARAFAEDGEEIHEPDCTWTIDPADGDVVLSSTARDSATLTSEVVANATVTCTIAGVAGGGTVAFVTPDP